MMSANWSAPVPLSLCNAGNAHNPPAESQGALTGEGAPLSPSPLSVTWYKSRSLGALPDGREAVLFLYSGGGSGSFGSILALSRQPRPDGEIMLTVTTLRDGGDRCNGGIQAAQLTKDALMVTMATTPAELMDAAGAKDQAGLPDCAICCGGTIVSRRSVAEGKEELVAAEVTEDGLESGGGTEGKDGQCFAKVIHASAPSLPHDYDSTALMALVKAFDACVAGGGR